MKNVKNLKKVKNEKFEKKGNLNINRDIGFIRKKRDKENKGNKLEKILNILGGREKIIFNKNYIL